MFLTFLLSKFSHLRQFYSTDHEFINHLIDGGVTIPLKDVLGYVEEYNRGRLPSAHQIGDEVQLRFDDLMTRAKVLAVHFTKSKVRYDLDVILNEEHTTRIYNVDSCQVEKFVGFETT